MDNEYDYLNEVDFMDGYDLYAEECKDAIEQFKISKEFAFTDENPRMKRFYELAIDALIRQIPLKVKHLINMNGKYDKTIKCCYSCGNIVSQVKYCNNCGRRLDWEEFIDFGGEE